MVICIETPSGSCPAGHRYRQDRSVLCQMEEMAGTVESHILLRWPVGHRAEVIMLRRIMFSCISLVVKCSTDDLGYPGNRQNI